MLLLRKPNLNFVRDFLDQQRQMQFTYEAVGATATSPPDGFQLDHTRVELGSGERVFVAGREALENWQQFQIGWVHPAFAATPIRTGEGVAIIARAIGLWWLNACRIIYVIDEQQPHRRFGFAYGTLPDHAESGEERFMIEMDAAGTVWYDILAFSRPRHILARIGNPYVRRLQKRFARESAARMQRIARGAM